MLRSSNFTLRQVDMLLDSLEACPTLISGKLDSKIPTKQHLKLAWEAVAQKINESEVGHEKTGDQFRGKWNDMKYRIKQKAISIFKNKGKGESLSPSDKRALSLMGWKHSEPLTNSDFDTTSASVSESPIENFHAIIENSEGSNVSVCSEKKDNHLEVTIKTEIETSNEVSNCSLSNSNITQEIHNESPAENASHSENDLRFAILKTDDDNASNEVSDFNLPNTIIIKDVCSELSNGPISTVDKEKTNDCPLLNITSVESCNKSSKENASVNDVLPEASTHNWPYDSNRPNNSTERGRRFRDRKRKLCDEAEDRFMKKVFTTQEKMAADINEIKLSIIDMNYNMKRYIEKMDQKFDKILDLMAIALNADMR